MAVVSWEFLDNHFRMGISFPLVFGMNLARRSLIDGSQNGSQNARRLKLVRSKNFEKCCNIGQSTREERNAEPQYQQHELGVSCFMIDMFHISHALLNVGGFKFLAYLSKVCFTRHDFFFRANVHQSNIWGFSCCFLADHMIRCVLNHHL